MSHLPPFDWFCRVLSFLPRLLEIFPVVDRPTKKYVGRSETDAACSTFSYLPLSCASHETVRIAKLFGSIVRVVFPCMSSTPVSVVGSVSENMSVTDMETHDKLADLLLREDILSKVLVHLVDSGLHECRHVCRKWYEVCNKLPVKLSLSLSDDRRVKPEVFPNAVSLTLTDETAWHSAVIESHLLPCLSRLNRISHLEFSVQEWPLVQFQQNSPTALDSVRSLSLCLQTESAFLDFLETLRCLTELRALKLQKMSVFGIIDVAPITEIKKLRELRAKQCFLFNRQNEFIFGTQTQLTRLEVIRNDCFSGLTNVTLQVMSVPVRHLLGCILLQSIYPHTPNLRSLTFDGIIGLNLQVKDCDALKHLSQLDDLVLRRIVVEEEDFASVLKNLSGLTTLEISGVSMSNVTRVLDCIFAMSKLKALTFAPGWTVTHQICTPTRTSQMQLTKLCWESTTSLLQMMRLTEVAHLDILIWGQNCGVVVRALESMPNLQWLKIAGHRGENFLPSDILVGMRKLKGFYLRRVNTDAAICQTLAMLPEFTDLMLDFRYGLKIETSTSSLSEINLLSNLKSLRMIAASLEQADYLLDSLSGVNLKRLQTVHVIFSKLASDSLTLPSWSDRHRAALSKRLPSLRHFDYHTGLCY